MMLRSDSQARALAAQSAIKLLTPLAEGIHIHTQTSQERLQEFDGGLLRGLSGDINLLPTGANVGLCCSIIDIAWR